MPCTRAGIPLRFIPTGDGHVRRKIFRIVQIATSLASFFDAGQLIGKQVPIKTDVETTLIRGVESEARFIAILSENDEPVLLLPEKAVQNGAVVL